MSLAFLAATPVLELRASECELSPCAGSLRGTPGTPESLYLSVTILAGFYNQKLQGLLSLAETLARGPNVGLGPFTTQGAPLQLAYPSQFLSTT